MNRSRSVIFELKSDLLKPVPCLCTLIRSKIRTQLFIPISDAVRLLIKPHDLVAVCHSCVVSVSLLHRSRVVPVCRLYMIASSDNPEMLKSVQCLVSVFGHFLHRRLDSWRFALSTLAGDAQRSGRFAFIELSSQLNSRASQCTSPSSSRSSVLRL